MQSKNLPIKNLLLWDENARFPDKYFNSDEQQLIKYFLLKPESKIKQLIESISRDIDLPQLEKIVVWKDDNDYIVIEGNRRLTAFKLIANPNLTDNEKIKKTANEAKEKINIDNDFLLECIVCENKEDALRYVDRKHANGNNEVNWGEPERLNYEFRRGNENNTNIIKLEITNIVRNLNLPDEMKEKILGKGYVTTFFRAITTRPAKIKYGYKIENSKLEIKHENFEEELKVIIYSILKKEDFAGKIIDSRTLNKTENIAEFINSIKSEQTEKVNQEIEKKTTENIFGDKTVNIGVNNINLESAQKQKSLPKSTHRKNLIPKNFNLKINEPKINNIFRELRDDLLLDDTINAVPNATGVLFRVFLEVCLDYYAKKNQFNFSSAYTIKQKIPWVTNHLINKGYDEKEFSNINKVGSAKKENTYLSIENFHEYVHSHTTQPSSSELKLKWDNLQSFFELIWSDLNKIK